MCQLLAQFVHYLPDKHELVVHRTSCKSVLRSVNQWHWHWLCVAVSNYKRVDIRQLNINELSDGEWQLV